MGIASGEEMRGKTPDQLCIRKYYKKIGRNRTELVTAKSVLIFCLEFHL